MAGKADAIHTDTVEQIHRQDQHALETEPPMQHIAEYQEAEHIELTWKSWMVVVSERDTHVSTPPSLVVTGLMLVSNG